MNEREKNVSTKQFSIEIQTKHYFWVFIKDLKDRKKQNECFWTIFCVCIESPLFIPLRISTNQKQKRKPIRAEQF